MYEELCAPLPDAGAYLERIGLPGARPEPTVQWLDRLIHAQLTHVPFEAMDCWGRGDVPSLSVEDLFDKIVRRRRGGYCFELNSLMLAFLRALGFDAYIVTVHLLRDFVPPPAHCAVVCVIDGEKYFCDVGYGGPVPDGCVKYGGSLSHGYRVVGDGDYRCLERVDDDGTARKVMLYSDVPAPNVDLIPLNYYVSQRPDSSFRSVLNVNLRLEDGSAWIRGKRFCLRSAGQSVDRELRDTDDLREVLERFFGIPGEGLPLRALDGQPGITP